MFCFSRNSPLQEGLHLQPYIVEVVGSVVRRVMADSQEEAVAKAVNMAQQKTDMTIIRVEVKEAP